MLINNSVNNIILINKINNLINYNFFILTNYNFFFKTIVIYNFKNIINDACAFLFNLKKILKLKKIQYKIKKNNIFLLANFVEIYFYKFKLNKKKFLIKFKTSFFFNFYKNYLLESKTKHNLFFFIKKSFYFYNLNNHRKNLSFLFNNWFYITGHAPSFFNWEINNNKLWLRKKTNITLKINENKITTLNKEFDIKKFFVNNFYYFSLLNINYDRAKYLIKFQFTPKPFRNIYYIFTKPLNYLNFNLNESASIFDLNYLFIYKKYKKLYSNLKNFFSIKKKWFNIWNDYAQTNRSHFAKYFIKSEFNIINFSSFFSSINQTCYSMFFNENKKISNKVILKNLIFYTILKTKNYNIYKFFISKWLPFFLSTTTYSFFFVKSHLQFKTIKNLKNQIKIKSLKNKFKKIQPLMYFFIFNYKFLKNNKFFYIHKPISNFENFKYKNEFIFNNNFFYKFQTIFYKNEFIFNNNFFYNKNQKAIFTSLIFNKKNNFFLNYKLIFNKKNNFFFILPFYGFLYVTYKSFNNFFNWDNLNYKRYVYSFSLNYELQKYIIKKYLKNKISSYFVLNKNLKNSDNILYETIILNNKNNFISNFKNFTNVSKLIYTDEFFFFNWYNFIEKREDIDLLLFNEQINLNIKRIKFKPGYMRIWREARSVFKIINNLTIKYQYRLTRYISKLIKFVKFKYFNLLELQLNRILIKSRLIFDLDWANNFIKNGLIYINGYNCFNPYLQMFTGDFIQTIIHLKYYILYKWLINWNIKKKKILKSRTKKKLYFQSLSDEKMKSYRLPTWILNNKYLIEDVSKFLEVDYFSLSIFIIYEPFSWVDVDPFIILGSRYNVINMYNWKYIT